MSPKSPKIPAPPAGAVNAIRAARQWPVFESSHRTKFWINALLTIVALAASYGAALGQAGFAEMYLGMHGPERFVVFLIIEATAVALMLLANQTALAGDSAGGLWTLVWVVTAGAVTMQVIHAYAIGKPEAAMVYATASVLTVILWRAKTRRGLRDRLRAAGMIEDPLPRYRPVRWVLRPRETFRAWYLALGEGVSDPATATDMARADHLYRRAAAAARADLRRARKSGAERPDLSDQRHVVPPWRVTDPAAELFGVRPWHVHDTAAVLAAPSRPALTAPPQDAPQRPAPVSVPASRPAPASQDDPVTVPSRDPHKVINEFVGLPANTPAPAPVRASVPAPATRDAMEEQTENLPTVDPAIDNVRPIAAKQVQKDRDQLEEISRAFPGMTWQEIRDGVSQNEIERRTGIRKPRIKTLLINDQTLADSYFPAAPFAAQAMASTR